MKHVLRNYGNALLLVLVDCFCIALSHVLALLVRVDFRFDRVPMEFAAAYLSFIPYITAGMVAVYVICRLYRRLWRFAGIRELELCIVATALCMGFHWILMDVFFRGMPFFYTLCGGIIQGAFLLMTRFSPRIIRAELLRYTTRNRPHHLVPVMVIGAGDAGVVLIRELNLRRDTGCSVSCVIDDDPGKTGTLIEGVPVVGGRADIPNAVYRYGIRRIILAIPSLSLTERCEILNICSETGCELKTFSGIRQALSDGCGIRQRRDVSIDELLGRPPIQVDNTRILESLKGKVVLVTGGGGSIGSELCRQIARHSPRQLIIFDVYENNAYDIQQELRRKHGSELNLTVLIGSVRDTLRINQVFQQYKPEVVFHAAAHKHVPLMEDTPCEAIKNNVLGTYKTACAAIANGVRRFVLISSDKAVNPTNIMGASKRLCEMVVQTLDKLGAEDRLQELPQLRMHTPGNPPVVFPHGICSPLPAGQHTEFVAVRFGNVLGSNGSVVPLFMKQIAEGGPVTVTSPDIIRYFMTISEAVSLVLQAETYASGGEVFVFDMGKPLKIDELARKLIRLSGFKPDVDIKVLYTGLRPGEKLYEERLMDLEELKQTPNKLISIARPVIPPPEVFLPQLLDIAEAAYTNDDEMKDIVSRVVYTYRYSQKTAEAAG